MRCLSTLLVLFSVLLSQAYFGCLASQHQQLIILHDPSRHALRSAAASVSPAAATATLCAASGLVPPFSVDETTAAHVEDVVQAQSVLSQAPKALLLLHLAGVTPGEQLWPE